MIGSDGVQTFFDGRATKSCGLKAGPKLCAFCSPVRVKSTVNPNVANPHAATPQQMCGRRGRGGGGRRGGAAHRKAEGGQDCVGSPKLAETAPPRSLHRGCTSPPISISRPP